MSSSDHEFDPPLSAQQEAAVRRALAAAGGAEPMPEQIVDRLDGVIAELAAERATGTASGDRPDEAPTPPAPGPLGTQEHRVVVPLDAAARRRRTRAQVLLGAAAVVIAVAVGAGVLNNHRGDKDVATADQMAKDDPERSDSGGDAATNSEESAAEPTPGDTASEAPTLGAVPTPHDLKRVVTDEPLREVRPDNLRADLVALQQRTLPVSAAADYDGVVLTAPAAFRCSPAQFGNGYLVGVSYAGKSAVVAFREPMGATQVADVLACGTGDVLRSTTIPAPR